MMLRQFTCSVCYIDLFVFGRKSMKDGATQGTFHDGRSETTPCSSYAYDQQSGVGVHMIEMCVVCCHTVFQYLNGPHRTSC